jgi:hypothetical protein
LLRLGAVIWADAWQASCGGLGAFPDVKPHISHTTHHTPHTTLKPHTSHLTPLTSHLSPHTSHLTPLTSHLTPLTSHLTPHTSHLTPHTSHLSPHTSHLSPHTSTGSSGGALQGRSICSLKPAAFCARSSPTTTIMSRRVRVVLSQRHMLLPQQL